MRKDKEIEEEEKLLNEFDEILKEYFQDDNDFRSLGTVDVIKWLLPMTI